RPPAKVPKNTRRFMVGVLRLAASPARPPAPKPSGRRRPDGAPTAARPGPPPCPLAGFGGSGVPAREDRDQRPQRQSKAMKIGGVAVSAFKRTRSHSNREISR